MNIKKIAGTATLAAALGAAALGLGAGSAQADPKWVDPNIPWIPGDWNPDWNPGVNWGAARTSQESLWPALLDLRNTARSLDKWSTRATHTRGAMGAMGAMALEPPQVA